MGKILYKALKIFLWLLLFLLLAGLAYLFARWKGWPLWTGAVLLLGPIGLIMAGVFLRKHLFRRREKRFVKRIVEQEPDKLALAQAAASREWSINDLRASFARAHDILRRSRLTRFKDPVYALPWFVLAGESGAGKSSALRSAQLNSLLTDLNLPGADRPGGQCEWWFQENGVILDVTGRFMDVDGDGDAWRAFLALLAKYRRREPLNGLITAVSAERLLGGEDQVVTAARAARRRLDELMRVLGARFPVYVLVTKLDRVSGFDGFSSRMSEEERFQAMGAMNPVSPDKPGVRAGEIVSLTAESLKTLRLILADRIARTERSGPPPSGLTRFPDAFSTLGAGVTLYCRELFQKNPYLETPLFRGLYFSSARREPAEQPAESGVLAQFTESPAKGEARPGVFLHDFFGRILPQDRKLHSPLPSFLSWRDVTRFAALASVLALTLCAAGLFTYSYMRNNAALTTFSLEFSQTPKLTSDLASDVDMMLKFRDTIVDMEKQNADWDLPRLGFDQSLTAEARLKELYCDLFKRGVLTQFDWLLKDEAMTFSEKTPPDQIQRFASYIVNRIRLVESAMAGQVDMKTAEAVYEALGRLVFKGARVDPLFADRYEALHLNYLAWNVDQNRYALERASLTGLLEHVLRVSRVELSWLLDWANDLPGLAPITMEQFWGSTALEQTGLAEIPPAFTLQGRSLILRMAREIQKTLEAQGKGGTWLARFEDWYANEYVSAWERFADGFSGAVGWQRSQDQWRMITSRMAEPDNPYLMLLTAMGEQVGPYADRADNPDWVKPVMNFNFMRLQAITPQKASIEEKVSSDVSEISHYFNSLSMFTKRRLPGESGGDEAQPDALSPQNASSASSSGVPASSQPADAGLFPGGLGAEAAALKGITYFKGYLKALQSLRDAARTPASSLALMASKFAPPASSQAPASPAGATGAPPGQSPFDAAEKSVQDLETALGGLDAGIFDELLVGPLRFFWGVGVVDAAAGLQNQWEEGVLVRVGHMPENKLPGALFDEKTGLVWKFADGPAAPFLGKNAYGYFAKETNGTTFPFTDAFLSFLNKGSTQTQKIMPGYDVTAMALPTDVNKGAQQEPYATELILDCKEKVQKLENYNYPVTLIFKWDAATCADTTLNIRFKSFTATRNYSGALGFAKFLQDFQYDVKKFTPDDFPETKNDFDIFGIKTVTVQYKLSGGVPLIGLLKAETYQVPETITHAWGL